MLDPMYAAAGRMAMMMATLTLLLPLLLVGSSGAAATEPLVAVDNWFECAKTCADPSLCSPLSPQPGKRLEVVAPLAGGPGWRAGP